MESCNSGYTIACSCQHYYTIAELAIIIQYFCILTQSNCDTTFVGGEIRNNIHHYDNCFPGNIVRASGQTQSKLIILSSEDTHRGEDELSIHGNISTTRGKHHLGWAVGERTTACIKGDCATETGFNSYWSQVKKIDGYRFVCFYCCVINVCTMRWYCKKEL